MVHTRPSRTDPLHLSICRTVTPRLVSRRGRNWCSVRSQEMTACYMSASVANRLQTRCFLRGQKGWQSLGPILPDGLVIAALRLGGCGPPSVQLESRAARFTARK
jgi:hypothetical protein